MDEHVALLPLSDAFVQEELEGRHMAHNYDQHFDDLREEALVADFLASLTQRLDLLPDPLLAAWVASDLLPREEGLDEDAYQLRLEELIELLLVIGACQSKWHEGELKHVVLGFPGRRRRLDLGQRNLHDALLALGRGVLWDVDRAQGHQRLQVELDLTEEVLEEVEENLSIGTVVFAIDDESLLDFHVDFSGHLGGNVPRSVFVEPLFAQNVENVRVGLVLEALRVELGVRVDQVDQVDVPLRNLASGLTASLVVTQHDVQ